MTPTIEREFRPDMPVDEITPHPDNPRHHDRASIREGLETNPQYKPIVVQKSTNYILAGNGTYAVATEDLGWTTIDVYLVDLDDTTARRVLAADNEIGAESGYFDEPLAKLLTSIIDETGDLTGTGVSVDYYEDVLARLGEEGSEAVEELASSGPPPVLHEPPATNAAYAETEEEEAERAAKVASQTPHHAQGISEVVLPFTDDDKAEFGRLVADARAVLGSELRTPEVVLRAMRVLLTCLDAKDSSAELDMSTLLRAADYQPESDEAA
ncbi:ParB N-terminal domain-containing protein [Actinopolyspora erythraea]|uniref:hypothetical protein n=1 Tax=Actinopolyspora erythraea TaxID=414996 RepID=UPI0006945E5D|nr:hypothetical protein [Actinopolyspora erythraea]